MSALTGEVRRVGDVLLGRIIDGTYPRGLRLPAEAALAEELGCGRSTIREALRYLGDLGLIKSRRGSGALVLDFRREGSPALLPAYLRAGRFDDAPRSNGKQGAKNGPHKGEAQPVALAREMLRLRTLMAVEATRLAARYATDLSEAQACLAKAPSLESDPAAHALNELDMYRALVLASGIWPAAWLVNAFWAPLREVNALFAPALGAVQSDFQRSMTHLLELVEQGREQDAVDVVEGWFERVDQQLVTIFQHALQR